MRVLHKGLLLAPLLAVFAAEPAMAQAWKWDFGVNAGWSKFTAMLDEEDTGLGVDVPGGGGLRFLQRYFLQRGFLDGLAGLRYCALLAQYERLQRDARRQVRQESRIRGR